MSVRLKPKIRCSSSVINRRTRSSIFVVWKLMLKFVQWNYILRITNHYWRMMMVPSKCWHTFRFVLKIKNTTHKKSLPSTEVDLVSMIITAVQYLMEGSTAMECTQLSERTSESTLRTIFQCERPSLHNFRV